MDIVRLAVVTVFFLSMQNYNVGGGRGTITNDADTELERQLKILNKPPIKTIQTKMGDTLDCIDIYRQPAFDHPLLKDHKIQMQPGLPQEETTNKIVSPNAKASEISLALHNEIKCPLGTVPIRRTKKEELVNAKHPIKNSKSHQTSTYPITTMPYHSVSIEPLDEDIYYGGKAVITVPNPTVEHDQFTTTQIWIQNGPSEKRNSIEFGWAVYPKLAGDNKSRIFGYWTADGYQNTGCFNMLCPGFVQIHRRYALGTTIWPNSKYGGKQYGVAPMVYREPRNGNWWLTMGYDKIGYYPKELFTHLANNASLVRYGGVAGADANRPSPPMGNGHFPDKDYKKTSYIKSMKVIDQRGVATDFDSSRVRLKQDTTLDCYKLRYLGYVDKFYEIAMMFGGPGGMCPYQT